MIATLFDVILTSLIWRQQYYSLNSVHLTSHLHLHHISLFYVIVRWHEFDASFNSISRHLYSNRRQVFPFIIVLKLLLQTERTTRKWCVFKLVFLHLWHKFNLLEVCNEIVLKKFKLLQVLLWKCVLDTTWRQIVSFSELSVDPIWMLSCPQICLIESVICVIIV